MAKLLSAREAKCNMHEKIVWQKSQIETPRAQTDITNLARIKLFSQHFSSGKNKSGSKFQIGHLVDAENRAGKQIPLPLCDNFVHYRLFASLFHFHPVKFPKGNSCGMFSIEILEQRYQGKNIKERT